jgi:hypothetical protein
MAVTRQERDQVVELLRCAADCCMNSAGALSEACEQLDVDRNIERRAWDALSRVKALYFKAGLSWMENDVYCEILLEAAALVEEGWEP